MYTMVIFGRGEMSTGGRMSVHEFKAAAWRAEARWTFARTQPRQQTLMFSLSFRVNSNLDLPRPTSKLDVIHSAVCEI